ncbi:hypothetical protein GGR42_000102 [Saonia flava]|uniref:YD repeat-containing protein n=1 Tax=Saonia flava TaxID=523696 RepID=A0A846QRN2_9FLAO|nr:hypothetical protein [Saonia flava]NJB69640.1 hypothetical protein [Saonia flava]
MKKHYTITFLFVFCWMNTLLYSQEVRIFTLNDFDLKGDVKSCLVMTDYGKEEFDFDEKGYLTKLVTRYNDSDYTTTHYKYDSGELMEKRVENYIDGEFDESTSIANFYEIDTTQNRKVTEKIFSYSNEALDQYEYIYDGDNRLVSIKKTNNDGVDETVVDYTIYKGESTTSYLLNGVVQKSIRTSEKKKKNGKIMRTVLTKEFLEGNPIKASEEIFGDDQKLISETKFTYDTVTKGFVPAEKLQYSYNEKGMISGLKSNREGTEDIKKFIYQYDGEPHQNWIKKIRTPDNAYTTRKIEYYAQVEVTQEK